MRETKKVPKEITGIFNEEQFDKSRSYEMEKFRFSFVKSVYDTCILMLVFYFEVLPKSYEYSTHITGKLGFNTKNELYINIIFLTLLSMVSTLQGIPFSLYYTFVLEEKYGFNKQTLKFYIKDKIKKLLVGIILTNLITTIVIYVVIISGPHVYIYAPMTILFIQIFFVSIYQDYIAPIFDKFVPLKKGTLYNMIEALSTQVKFPLGSILVVEGSQRSSHSNAYFIGIFGKRTIVLYDTLFQNINDYIEKIDEKLDNSDRTKLCCDDDEIVAILAHELGHWKHKHILKGLLLSMVETITMFYIFGKLSNYPPIFTALGFYDSHPVLIGLIINFCFIFSPISFFSGWFTTCMSRRFEFQADSFSVQLGYGEKLSDSLKVIHVSNLSFPVYDPIYSSMNLSHPSLLQRLQHINAMSDKIK